ncbi:5'-methylthioadenosine/adenosylhomocysteine nucleosidase [Ancylobacter oerskovii]|uniref:adenosylhomocysteine nucleosidase n=1 Tax=Ancylobacter oerskovii TaxID=459519 RepID=A0ABW4Z2Z0_9HYPH|nr:5'-methylthioadenosine/adenosylhomocysteine nucleosidase [Ancylobacter oerskovii]MBS7546299.1 5'-methylthioadenosine/adenosylhomocysteine nucleosidase [Ancylobacter oerskovii]
MSPDGTRRIGVLCALEQEVAYLLDNLEHAETFDTAGMAFHAGRLDGEAVVLAKAGMGKVNAAIATTLLIERFGARAVMFSGVAGGLDPALSVGDIVIADHVIQHDHGYEGPGGFVAYQHGHQPYFNPFDGLGIALDPALAARIAAALADVELAPLAAAGDGAPAPRLHFGRVLTGDQFINNEQVREALFRDFAAKAVEMEGAAMAQACAAFGVPWVVIRALSDLAGHSSHFDVHRFLDEVARSGALIVRRLLPVV